VTGEAIILVGGQGTRLRPLTLAIPKPMLPVAGVPFLTHQLLRLRAAGIGHVVLGTAYRPDVVAGHFGDGSALGLALSYATEETPLGTGGGIRHAAQALHGGGDVVVLNGDVLSGHSIEAQLRAHRAGQADVTLHLTEVEDPRAFGCVPTDGDGRVTAFLEKTDQPPTNRVNAGCYVFRHHVIDAIPPGRPVSVERETFPELLASGAVVQAYVEPAYWLDVGTPAAFVRGSADLVTGRAPSAAVPVPGEALVAPDAVVAGVVRGGTTVGPRARVEAGAVVEGSVLLDDAVVASSAVVRASAVGRRSVVGPGSRLEDTVLGDDVVLGARNELRAGARVWPGTRLGNVALRFSTDA
jgi:mannose-1-phosphate guanylyltransferase